MPGPILTASTRSQCPHAAMGTMIPGSSRVLVDGGLPLVAGDRCTFAGCAFTVPPVKPQPCVTGLLLGLASKVLIENKPALLVNPSDIAQSADQIPAGPVIVTQVQSKVIAT